MKQESGDKKLMIRRSWMTLISLGLVSLPAFAGEIFEFYNGVREMGMGGAAVAVVNDETAMLLNPAALGRLRDYIITVIDPEVEGNTQAPALAGLSFWQYFSPQPMLDKLKITSNLGKRLHLKGQLFPSIVVPNFGFGVYGKYSTDGRVDPTGTDFELHYTNDYAAVMAFNFRLFEGIIKLGANARAINRVQIDETAIDATRNDLTVDNLAGEGFGVASDVGLVMTAPVVLLPTLAAVWRDVGSTSYNLKSGMVTSATTKPSSTRQTLDVGMAIFPILGKSSRSTFTLEYRDILTASQETDQMRRAHAGIEFNLADALFLRAGMNQRYWTAGLEISMFNYQLQFASYGEEVGTATTAEEDRRYTAKFSFRF